MSNESGESTSRLVLLPKRATGDDSLPKQYLDAHRGTDGKSMVVQYSSATGLDPAAWTADPTPATLFVIVVDERLTGPVGGHADRWRTVATDVDEIRNGGDLTLLAMTCNRRLEALTTDEDTPVVWFDSLTETLDHVDIDGVVRFLQVSMGTLENIGATAHFLCRPDRVDSAAVTTLRRVFSTVIEVTDDGWTIEEQ